MTYLLVLSCIVSLAPGQWTETTIYLPDSLPGLDSIYAVHFHSPSNTVYLGGSDKLVAVDAGTRRELAGIRLPGPVSLMCSITAGNKLYCASLSRESVWVVDCATNGLTEAVALDGRVWAMCYAAGSNKVYVTCPADTLVDVIDCDADSVVASIDLKPWPGALCHNPGLNRVYVAKQTSDEVAVIDCSSDTVVSTIWLRGVKPTGVYYDSATNCVYTTNHTSGTSSVIDCAGDSLVRVVAVGAGPERMVVGPAGKVYCGGYSDSVVTAIELQGTHTITVGQHLSGMSYDPVNNKVCCAMSDSEVVVIDAISDTVVARVAAGEAPRFVCFDPVDAGTWVAGASGARVGVIDGATCRLTDMLWFGAFAPAALCYSSSSNRLYCLALYRNDSSDVVLVVDGDSNRVAKVLPTSGSPDSMLWNQSNNKVYFTSTVDNTVSILDCARDSIIAAVQTGDSPNSMCTSDDGRVYITTKGGVAVIDPGGDSLRTVVATPYDPTSLCYDRIDNKIYASHDRNGLVSVIDAYGDSVVASVPVPESCGRVCWNQNHNKVYGCADYAGLVVIDCTSDTVLRILDATLYVARAYSDSAIDKIYMSSGDQNLYVFDAASDSLLYHTKTYSLSGFLDNGQPGAANRVYCPCYDYRNEGLLVVSGAGNYVLRTIEAGEGPRALAWNSLHSWVYVSSSASSCITVVSDTMLGVEDERPQASSHTLQATVVRGVLNLGVGSRQQAVDRAELLDVGGRKVMDLKSGANDVRALAPGVYFVVTPSPFSSPPEGERVGVRGRQASGMKRYASSVTKVVVTR